MQHAFRRGTHGGFVVHHGHDPQSRIGKPAVTAEWHIEPHAASLIGETPKSTMSAGPTAGVGRRGHHRDRRLYVQTSFTRKRTMRHDTKPAHPLVASTLSPPGLRARAAGARAMTIGDAKADGVGADGASLFTLAALRALIDKSSTATIVFDADEHVLYANVAAVAFAKVLNPDNQDRATHCLHDWHPDLLPPGALQQAMIRGSWIGEVVLRSGSGQKKILLEQISTIGPNGGAPYGLSVRDISIEHLREIQLRERNADLEIANTKLEGAQENLIQSEKLASIGQLAAGVAHEINNPIGYVNSNLSTLQQYVANLLAAIDTYTRALASSGDAAKTHEAEEIRRRFDIDFLAVDLPQLLVESREGIERVCKIVRDLKDFSRSDRGEAWTPADLHRGLESTLNIVCNELKYKAVIVKTFGELPLVECLPSELNQVFMNILMNAGQAISERGVITVSTGASDDKVWIAIGDDGEGIPAAVLPRIFDPFFTTKPVGTGTGLGLSISYGIVAKHHGSIQITSEAGQGTLLRIELPIKQPAA
jgi:two-component system NtrC family sensor kinase